MLATHVVAIMKTCSRPGEALRLITQALFVCSCTLMLQPACTASTIRLAAFYTVFHVAGSQNGTQSTSNSSVLWSGSINLPIGYFNLTIEYHNGNGSGALVLQGGYVGSGIQVSLCWYALDAQ